MKKPAATATKYASDADATKAILQELDALIPTLEVKSASASRAGRSIQCRLTWTEAGGKKGLGYVSASVSKSKLSGGIAPITVLLQVPRVHQRATIAVANSADQHAVQSGASPWQRAEAVYNDVKDALSGNQAHLAVAVKLCQEMHPKMLAVLKNDGHQVNRRKSTQKRAREALANTLDFVLGAGISDDEVREMLKEALVRHTMES